MAKNIYAEELASARRMLTGMKANPDLFNKHGIDENYIIQFERAINEAAALNAVPTPFLFRPKSKAIALQARVSVIRKLTAASKKLVKLDYPKESWREFGIMDPR